MLSRFFLASMVGWLALDAGDSSVYGGIAVGLLISAGILALLIPRVKKLMGTVH